MRGVEGLSSWPKLLAESGRQTLVLTFLKGVTRAPAPEPPAISGPHILGGEERSGDKGTLPTITNHNLTHTVSTMTVVRNVNLWYMHRSILVWR